MRILPELQRANGYIRSEIAGSINRKRVPELSFRCQPVE
jgi:ribosome-binding factor A